MFDLGWSGDVERKRGLSLAGPAGSDRAPAEIYYFHRSPPKTPFILLPSLSSWKFYISISRIKKFHGRAQTPFILLPFSNFSNKLKPDPFILLLFSYSLILHLFFSSVPFQLDNFTWRKSHFECLYKLHGWPPSPFFLFLPSQFFSFSPFLTLHIIFLLLRWRTGGVWGICY